MKTGVISQAAGSAYVELAKTKVMCGVYGPRQPQRVEGMEFGRGRLDVDVKLATFATAGARGKVAQGDAEREFSQLVHRALAGAVILETFPKTSVDVYVTVLEAGGAELPAVVAAASAAPPSDRRRRRGRGARAPRRGLPPLLCFGHDLARAPCRAPASNAFSGCPEQRYCPTAGTVP